VHPLQERPALEAVDVDIGAFETGSPDHIFADGFEPET
jgi:hypothetical protein